MPIFKDFLLVFRKFQHRHHFKNSVCYIQNKEGKDKPNSIFFVCKNISKQHHKIDHQFQKRRDHEAIDETTEFCFSTTGEKEINACSYSKEKRKQPGQ